MVHSDTYALIKFIQDFFDIKKRPYMVAAISGFCFMILFEIISRKHPKFKEYGLGLAMVMAMIVAVLSKKMLLGV